MRTRECIRPDRHTTLLPLWRNSPRTSLDTVGRRPGFGKTLLDAGCGHGLFLLALSRSNYPDRKRVVGLDAHLPLLRIAFTTLLFAETWSICPEEEKLRDRSLRGSDRASAERGWIQAHREVRGRSIKESCTHYARTSSLHIFRWMMTRRESTTASFSIDPDGIQRIS